MTCVEILHMRISTELSYWESLNSLYKEGRLLRGSINIYGSEDSFKKRLSFVEKILRKHLSGVDIYRVTKPQKTPISPRTLMWRIFFKARDKERRRL